MILQGIPSQHWLQNILNYKCFHAHFAVCRVSITLSIHLHSQWRLPCSWRSVATREVLFFMSAEFNLLFKFSLIDIVRWNEDDADMNIIKTSFRSRIRFKHSVGGEMKDIGQDSVLLFDIWVWPKPLPQSGKSKHMFAYELSCYWNHPCWFYSALIPLHKVFLCEITFSTLTVFICCELNARNLNLHESIMW